MIHAVVALGGNAILRPGEKGSREEQVVNIRETSKQLAGVIKEGKRIVLTHGNGPQVGNILLQNEAAKADVPQMPLDVCVGESQGQIGYLIQQSLENQLWASGIRMDVLPVLTRVEVARDDPAFSNPSKPIGPYYAEEEAKELEASGWVMKLDEARGGYRRLVPSPKPKSIVEEKAINALSQNLRVVVVAAGGGGIPVINEEGTFKGVEAVIDKDLASSLLATRLDAKRLIMLTDIDRVYIDFGKESQKAIDEITVGEAKLLLNEGHFPAGSMGPKIEAAIAFVENGGEFSAIARPQDLSKALEGKAGTIIKP